MSFFSRFRSCSALLFCLGRMSRTNEIVSMLTAGVSVPRLLVPLLVDRGPDDRGDQRRAELLARAACGTCAQDVLRWMRSDPARVRELLGQIFRNRTDNRTWFIQRFRPEAERIHHRAGAAAGRERQHRDELSRHAAPSIIPKTQAWELQAVEGGELRRSREHHAGGELPNRS